MRVAVVGVTGMVGQIMLDSLASRSFPVSQLIPVASAASIGKKVVFQGQPHTIIGLQEALDQKPELALFSAGGDVSRDWAPRFAEIGCTVIDNSSFWRMHPEIKLVVPEINAAILTAEDKIIANPNCSTIQLVMVMAPLHKKYGINRVLVSTYQSVSGTGQKAVQQLNDEISGINGPKAYPNQIHKNALPHCDVFLDNGYTKEEMKLATEPQKIMGDSSFKISATAVRIPTEGGHSESVNLTFNRDFDLSEVRHILDNTPGVILEDEPVNNRYPMPVSAHGKDEVFVGRLRRDLSASNSLNLWIVADNLRKGAATNAVQIAEYLCANHLI